MTAEEVLDGELVLRDGSLVDGVPVDLPAPLVAELVELLADAERYAQAAQAPKYHARVCERLAAVRRPV